MNQDQGGAGGAAMERPAVLLNATETQLEELDRQFDEGDQQAWHELTTSYGWTPEDEQAVWEWFGQRPRPEQS